MHDDYEDDSCDYVVYLDGDENNEEEGNVINKRDFHGLVSFEQFAEIMNTQDVLFKKIDALEAELALLRR
jgi:hypothetical protein